MFNLYKFAYKDFTILFRHLPIEKLLLVLFFIAHEIPISVDLLYSAEYEMP